MELVWSVFAVPNDDNAAATATVTAVVADNDHNKDTTSETKLVIHQLNFITLWSIYVVPWCINSELAVFFFLLSFAMSIYIYTHTWEREKKNERARE